jgi:Ca2+-binding EF-hand superfamily protein
MNFWFFPQDVDNDGIIGWDDLYYMFKQITKGNVSDFQLEHMVNKALDHFDARNENELTLKELSRMVPIDKLLTLFSIEDEQNL